MKSKILLFLSALLLFVSCYEEPNPYLEVSKETITVSNEGGTFTIPVSANWDWTASSSADWCKVPSKGKALDNQLVEVVIEPNEDYSDRTCQITIKSEGKVCTVNVHQGQLDGLFVPKAEFDITCAAQTVKIDVNSNIQYTAKVAAGSESWLSIASTKALTGSTVVVSVAENTSYDSREGYVEITASNGISQKVKITQGQKDEIILGASSFSVKAAGETIKVDVQHNVDFTATVEEGKDWLSKVDTKGLKTTTVSFEAKENATKSPREGKISISGSGLDREISVSQEAGKIKVNKTAFSIGTLGGEFTVKVDANISFKVESSESWVSVKSQNDDSVIFEVAENESTDGRSATVTIYNGEISNEISVSQGQKDEVNIIDADSAEIEAVGGIVTISVESNVSYKVTVEEAAKSWIKYIETKAMTASEVTLSVEPNHADSTRTGEVIISAGEIEKIYTITQDAAVLPTSIALDQEEIELPEGMSITLVATVKPENTTFNTVTWTSSDETVAKVEDGVVKGIAGGEAIITASIDTLTATCSVIVISEEELDLEHNVTVSLTGTSVVEVTDDADDDNSDENVSEGDDDQPAAEQNEEGSDEEGEGSDENTGDDSGEDEGDNPGDDEGEGDEPVEVEPVYLYGRTYTIVNKSKVAIELVSISTTNTIELSGTVEAGESFSTEIFLATDDYPVVTVSFKYNGHLYTISTESEESSETPDVPEDPKDDDDSESTEEE